jgi:hypothetical protein
MENKPNEQKQLVKSEAAIVEYVKIFYKLYDFFIN